jgi:hypothetical protein
VARANSPQGSQLEEQPDWPAYKPILMKVLKLLGKGVQWPLDYTKGDHLEATKGKHRNSNLEDWYKEVASKCLSHNNLAESLFAHAQSKDNRFQSMFLSTVRGQTAAARNGTYRRPSSPAKTNKGKEKALAQPGKKRELGAVFAAPAPLLESVRRLSSLKSKYLKSGASLIP